ncbi:hypothetical protein HJC99_01405 [Candidatus Saccharibacteria bacterium]|nr:hypothetical protein [Candidatus Saccharibacteria bacterium]
MPGTTIEPTTEITLSRGAVLVVTALLADANWHTPLAEQLLPQIWRGDTITLTFDQRQQLQSDLVVYFREGVPVGFALSEDDKIAIVRQFL